LCYELQQDFKQFVENAFALLLDLNQMAKFIEQEASFNTVKSNIFFVRYITNTMQLQCIMYFHSHLFAQFSSNGMKFFKGLKNIANPTKNK